MKKGDAVAFRLALILSVAAATFAVFLYSSDQVPHVASADGKGSSAGGKVSRFPDITLTRVATGFDHPTTIAHAGDKSNRLFILEQKGVIRVLRDGAVSGAPFLDITKLVRSRGSEQGLLGIAFAPDFAASRAFYVNYTNKTLVGNTVIARFTATADRERADPASRQQLMSIVQPFPNHNGGQLAFGPDGYLYIGTGDGGSADDPFGNGQKKKSLLGKILRISVQPSGNSPYSIPGKNPFGNEIWAYGMRNPWRFSFDRATGDLYIADVGQNEVEEIDFMPAGKGSGANYGWDLMEGSSCFEDKDCKKRRDLVLPVAEYRHGKGDCSVTGGYVYRGKIQALQGIYLYADFCSGRIWGLRKGASGWETQLLKDTDYAISTFGEDESGELYLADYTSGSIFRIGAE